MSGGGSGAGDGGDLEGGGWGDCIQYSHSGHGETMAYSETVE